MNRLRYWVVIVGLLLSSISLFAQKKSTLESQPQILFKHKELKESQVNRELLIKFNTAVLYLEQEKFLHAIALFKQSAKLLKIPSYLNIAVAYYKLNATKNAYLYFKKIYDFKDLKFNDKYSYFSAAYYLYKITGDKDYIDEITKVAAKAKRLNDHEKLLVVDTLILQKKYQFALDMAKDIKTISKLKIALLYIKLRNYSEARAVLDLAYNEAKGDDSKNEVIWLQLFNALKANDLINITDKIVKIEERRRFFKTQKSLSLELFFNKKRYTPKQYFDKITKFTMDRKIDFMYYFAPFVFEDSESLETQETKGFIIKNIDSITELNTIIDYNAKFLKLVKLDPIKRVMKLQEMLDAKFDTQSYEYYNLALSYAQIYDYNNAYRYFKKAYQLERGNKLYAIMTFITLKKLNIVENKKFKELLAANIVSNKGKYQFFSQYIYKIIEDPQAILDETKLSFKEKNSIFFRALYFLDNIDKKGIVQIEPLLVEFNKDPLVYLLNLVAKKENENVYVYISRIQDELPKIYNNNFLKGSMIITDFYIDTLFALGIFDKTNFHISNENAPTYLRLKAIKNLYNGNPQKSIELIEGLQNTYKLQSIDSYYILAAAYFAAKKDENAHITLSEIELLYNDRDAKFLTGIKLIQDMKLNSAVQYFLHKLEGKHIDFRLKNFDDFLESL